MLEPLKNCLVCGQVQCNCYFQPNTSWTLSNPLPLTEAQQCETVANLIKEYDALTERVDCKNCGGYLTPKEKLRLTELTKMLDGFLL